MVARANTISVDEHDALKDSLNQTENSGGVTSKILDCCGVRAKLRDPKYAANQKFISNAIGMGVLGEGITNSAPTFPIVTSVRINVG